MDYLLSAKTITGDDVKNAEGVRLGSIKDLMIDAETGKVEYAVLSFGGFLGVGDKYFAVPWQAFTVDRKDECLRLDVGEGILESAPGFDKDHWPDMADPRFQSEIYGHYGYEYRLFS